MNKWCTNEIQKLGLLIETAEESERGLWKTTQYTREIKAFKGIANSTPGRVKNRSMCHNVGKHDQSTSFNWQYPPSKGLNSDYSLLSPLTPPVKKIRFVFIPLDGRLTAADIPLAVGPRKVMTWLDQMSRLSICRVCTQRLCISVISPLCVLS